MRALTLVVGLLSLVVWLSGQTLGAAAATRSDPACLSLLALTALKGNADKIDRAFAIYRPNVATRSAALQSLPIAVRRYRSWASNYRALVRRANDGYLKSSTLRAVKPSLPSAWSGLAQTLQIRADGSSFYARLFAQFLSALRSGSSSQARRAVLALNSQGKEYTASEERANAISSARITKAARDLHQTIRSDGNIVIDC